MFFLIAWQPLRNKFFKLKIFTDAHCVICWNHRLIQLVWILPRQLIIWLSSLYDLCVPGCTPNVWACSWWLCGWCPEGSPPRPGSGHQRAPGQFIAGLGFAQYMMLHRCAIGFRSGEQEGQSMVYQCLRYQGTAYTPWLHEVGYCPAAEGTQGQQHQHK